MPFEVEFPVLMLRSAAFPSKTMKIDFLPPVSRTAAVGITILGGAGASPFLDACSRAWNAERAFISGRR